MDTQEQAVARFMPIIETLGTVYKKSTLVDARPAVEGEVVVTITAAGKETQNTAKADDWVVRNRTQAHEEYILPNAMFTARYMPQGEPPIAPGSSTPTSTWRVYQAIGECMAVKWAGENTEFVAIWGEPMQLHTGDMICTPLPQKGEVYRIAAQEFSETYRPKS
jgi:hypothetical protein